MNVAPFKRILAPMATLTHEALRILIHRWGDPDEYFSEMIHAPSFISGGHLEPWYVRTAPCPEKMVWQLTGTAVEPMAKAAEMLGRYGGIGVDLNMGCSAPDIFKTGAGIAWMLKPIEEVSELVRSVRKKVQGRLSVKLRLGEEENYEKLRHFCSVLVDEGVELITLHPRIKKDSYSRLARWEHVAHLASDFKVPIYGNGDIDSVEKAQSMVSKFPCNGVMIGRAAVRTPWIFGELEGKERGTIDHLGVSLFFLDTVLTSQPIEFHLSRARRFFFHYCENFTFAHHIKMRIQNAKTPEDIRGLLTEYFEQVPQDRFFT